MRVDEEEIAGVISRQQWRRAPRRDKSLLSDPGSELKPWEKEHEKCEGSRRDEQKKKKIRRHTQIWSL